MERGVQKMDETDFSAPERPCNLCIWHSADDGCTTWICEPITRMEAKELRKIVKCCECKHWRTGVAYEAVGRCKCEEIPQGLITNRNFYCAYGEKRDG